MLLGKNSWGISSSDYGNYWAEEDALKDIVTFADGVGAPLSLLLAGQQASGLGLKVRALGLELNVYTVRLPRAFPNPAALYSVLLQQVKVTGVISDQIDHFARFQRKLSDK